MKKTLPGRELGAEPVQTVSQSTDANVHALERATDCKNQSDFNDADDADGVDAKNPSEFPTSDDQIEIL